MHILTTLAALLEKGRPPNTWKAILFSLVLGKISSIFFNFQIHHLARPSLGIQGGSNVSKYFVNGCWLKRGNVFRYEIHYDSILFHLSIGGAAEDIWDETTSRDWVEREVWHQGLSWGDTLVFISRQLSQTSRKKAWEHFPKYILTLSGCCQLPKCYLSGDFGVSGASLFGWKEGRTVDGEEHGTKALKYLLKENIISVRSQQVSKLAW